MIAESCVSFMPTVSISINIDSLDPAPAASKKNSIIKFTCFRLPLLYKIYYLLLPQPVSRYSGHSNCEAFVHHYYYYLLLEISLSLHTNDENGDNTKHWTPLPPVSQISFRKSFHLIWITTARQFSFYIIFCSRMLSSWR